MPVTNTVGLGWMLVLGVTMAAGRPEVSPDLTRALERLASPEESLPVVLTLSRPPFDGAQGLLSSFTQSPPEHRIPTLIAALQGSCASSFAEVLGELKSEPGVTHLHMLWAGQMIAFRAPAEVIRRFSDRPSYVLELDIPLEIPPFVSPPESSPSSAQAEPGLSVINAPKLWRLGITGEGTTIMSLDTGVDVEHPALSRSWRGNRVGPRAAWFDPVYGSDRPRDYGIDPPGHGTMTMGVMVGLDSDREDTIGVAFGAEWIAAGDSVISISTQVACLQWALDPDGNPETIDDLPDVVNCSWTRGNPGCKTTGLITAISALEAAGIAVVFSAGNDGPDAGSVRWPARMNNTETDVFAVGYVNGHDAALPIGEKSGRGPTECSGEGDAIKPEVVAPGELVRTSWLQGGYATASGTSLSAPHVAGAIALLKQAFPEKTGTDLKLLLLEGAKDLGEEGEDNTYGYGCIDVYAAYLRGLSTAVKESSGPRFALQQNFPNPFNPLTHIRYEVRLRGEVLITIHSLLGVEVARLVDQELAPGVYEAPFDAAALPSGVYICRMRAGGFQQSRKLILVQ